MMWIPATVGDVCLPTTQIDPASHGVSTFRYVDIAGVDRGTKAISCAGEIPCIDAPSRARKVIRANDVLVSTVRPNLNAVALVPHELDGAIASTGFAVLRAKQSLLNPKFLFYRVQHPEFVDFLVANATGASYPAVTDGVVKRSPLPLPPPLEQSRISELLDEANCLRKLCREADATATRILPALFLNMFGIPDSWAKTEILGQLVHVKSGGTPSKSEPAFWSGRIPWVSPKDMKYDVIDDAEDHISASAIQQNVTQLVPTESILIVVRGMILARHVPIAITSRPVAINQDMKALILNDDRITPLFLFAAIKAQTSRLLSEVTTAAHGTKKIETSRLEALPIPIPSEQHLATFSAACKSILAIDENRNASSQKVERIFSLLMLRAFSGQLTARWREAHMKELIVEVEQQARALNQRLPKQLELQP
jgi:type I restriction enzyme, S subunit